MSSGIVLENCVVIEAGERSQKPLVLRFLLSECMKLATECRETRSKLSLLIITVLMSNLFFLTKSATVRGSRNFVQIDNGGDEMPRTYLSRKRDTRNDLIGEIQLRMKMRKINLDDLGKRFGVTGSAMSYRIRNLSLNYEQLVELMEILDFPPDKILWYASGGRFKTA